MQVSVCLFTSGFSEEGVIQFDDFRILMGFAQRILLAVVEEEILEIVRFVESFLHGDLRAAENDCSGADEAFRRAAASGVAQGRSAAISTTSPMPRDTRLTVPVRCTSPVNIQSSLCTRLLRFFASL